MLFIPFITAQQCSESSQRDLPNAYEKFTELEPQFLLFLSSLITYKGKPEEAMACILNKEDDCVDASGLAAYVFNNSKLKKRQRMPLWELIVKTIFLALAACGTVFVITLVGSQSEVIGGYAAAGTLLTFIVLVIVCSRLPPIKSDSVSSIAMSDVISPRITIEVPE